jgi:DNA-binding beta-propeller fold protein YncE
VNPERAPSFVAGSTREIAAVTSWQLPPGIEFDRVVGIAEDSGGRVYVAHRGDHPLLRFEAGGKFSGEIGAAVMRRSTAYDLRGPKPIPMGERYWLHGLHVDRDDNIWVTDVSRHLVLKFDPAGHLVLSVGVDGRPGGDAQHFNQPTHVAVASSGDFFVTDGYGNSRVVRFDRHGRRLREWGVHGVAPGQFHTPHVITIGPEERLYVSDRENDRIQIFDPDGQLLEVWPGLHGVDGLHAAGDGLIYGSCGVDHSLFVADRRGRVRDVWVRPDLFTYPHAVTVGRDGSILVADTGDNWVLDEQATATNRRRSYRLAPRRGGEGSRAVRIKVR